ncbi:hypothetical protein [Furfurilactobacillus curtus]
MSWIAQLSYWLQLGLQIVFGGGLQLPWATSNTLQTSSTCGCR